MALGELPAARKKGGTCSVGHILAIAGPDDREKIAAWLADPTVLHVQIAEALDGKIEGIATTATTIGRHRNGRCRCGK